MGLAWTSIGAVSERGVSDDVVGSEYLLARKSPGDDFKVRCLGGGDFVLKGRLHSTGNRTFAFFGAVEDLR